MEIRASDLFSKSTETSEVAETQEVIIPKKLVFGGMAILVFTGALVSGLLNRGYESKTISSLPFSRASYGNSFGMKDMYLRKGQTLTVNYDTEIEKGGLFIYVRKKWELPGSQLPGEVRVMQSKRGQLRVLIPETNVYQLGFRGSPGRNGYKLSYTASWRVE